MLPQRVRVVDTIIAVAQNRNSWPSFMFCLAYKVSFKFLKQILIHAASWMKLKDIMLSEIKPVIKGQMLYDSTSMRYPE